MPLLAPLGCTILTAPSPCCPGALAQTWLGCTAQVSSALAAHHLSAPFGSLIRRVLSRVSLALAQAHPQHEHNLQTGVSPKTLGDLGLRVSASMWPNSVSAPNERGMQRALTASPVTHRAPDEHRLLQRPVILICPQRRRDAATTASRRGLCRQQTAAWLAGLPAASAVRQPGRPDLQGGLPHCMIGAQMPGLE